MLNRLCLKDGVGLVNIVRSAEQANLLRGMERSLVAEQAIKGWLAPPSSGTALKRTAEWASAIFTSIRSAALLVVGPPLPQAGTAVVYLGLETHAQIERLIVRDGREFGSGSRSANSS